MHETKTRGPRLKTYWNTGDCSPACCQAKRSAFAVTHGGHVILEDELRAGEIWNYDGGILNITVI
jgi:hypothetical protein